MKTFFDHRRGSVSLPENFVCQNIFSEFASDNYIAKQYNHRYSLDAKGRGTAAELPYDRYQWHSLCTYNNEIIIIYIHTVYKVLKSMKDSIVLDEKQAKKENLIFQRVDNRRIFTLQSLRIISMYTFMDTLTLSEPMFVAWTPPFSANCIKRNIEILRHIKNVVEKGNVSGYLMIRKWLQKS